MQGMDREAERQAVDDDDHIGFDVRDVLRILRRRWRLIALMTLTFAAAGVAIALMIPNRYTAYATVQVEERRKEIVKDDGVIHEQSAGSSTIETEVEVIKSANLAAAVIDRLGLRADPEFGGDPDLEAGTPKPRGDGEDADSIADYVRELGADGETPVRDGVLLTFVDHIEVYRVRNSRLIEIGVTSKDPVKAARIANTIVDVYINGQLRAKADANALAARLLDKRIESLKGKLADAERKLEAFKQDNDLLDADGRFVLDRQLAQETEQLIKASNQTADARARYEQARRIVVTGVTNPALADVLTSNTVGSLRQQLSLALRRQAEIATRYGPRHPKFVEAMADVRKARGELTREVNAIIESLKSELRVAEARERQMRQNLEALKTRVAASRGKLGALSELSRDATTYRKLYEDLLARRKKMLETIGLQFPDAAPVQAATVPLSPSSPKRKQIAILAFLGGLALGFAMAVLLEITRPGYDRAEDVERDLMLDEIAVLPDPGSRDPLTMARLIVAEPQGHFAEAVRGLAHDLVRRRGSRQMILVMSALAGEGRSTVASNLAVQFAGGASRVLLIDADLRNGRLSAHLGLQGAPGLAEVLSGAATPSAALLHDATTGLHMMPSHAAPLAQTSPGELLASPQAANLFAVLKTHFDLVIVDAPPVLPFVDARILAHIADTSLMVVKWRATARSHIKQAIRALGLPHNQIQGLVINGVAESEYLDNLGIAADQIRLPSLGQRRAA